LEAMTVRSRASRVWIMQSLTQNKQLLM